MNVLALPAIQAIDLKVECKPAPDQTGGFSELLALIASLSAPQETETASDVLAAVAKKPSTAAPTKVEKDEKQEGQSIALPAVEASAQAPAPILPIQLATPIAAQATPGDAGSQAVELSPSIEAVPMEPAPTVPSDSNLQAPKGNQRFDAPPDPSLSVPRVPNGALASPPDSAAEDVLSPLTPAEGVEPTPQASSAVSPTSSTPATSGPGLQAGDLSKIPVAQSEDARQAERPAHRVAPASPVSQTVAAPAEARQQLPPAVFEARRDRTARTARPVAPVDAAQAVSAPAPKSDPALPTPTPPIRSDEMSRDFRPPDPPPVVASRANADVEQSVSAPTIHKTGEEASARKRDASIASGSPEKPSLPPAEPKVNEVAFTARLVPNAGKPHREEVIPESTPTVSSDAAERAPVPPVPETAPADRAPEKPSAPPQRAPEAPAVRESVPANAPARDIKLQLNSPEARVQVHLVERAGEVRVAVRTADTNLAGALRDDLPALAMRLEQSGFHAETWRGSANPDSADSQRQSPGGQQDQPRQRPDRQESEPDRKEERGDFSWLFASLQ